MSLILEALKKSERQRQVGTAPTLATPPMSRKRKRNLLPWLVGAIVVAGTAGWWFSRESVPEPASVAETTPAPAAAKVIKPEVPMTTVTAPPEKPVTPSATPANTQESQIAEVAKAVSEAAPATPTPPPPATSALPAAPAVVPAPPPSAPAIAPPAASVAATAPPRSAAASLPLLWELPYDKRKDIPQLTMSLQVYDADPAQRFAIVNDERHVEGDDLGGGLTLKEIAPEGLVVEYHGERFLFPRGGR